MALVTRVGAPQTMVVPLAVSDHLIPPPCGIRPRGADELGGNSLRPSSHAAQLTPPLEHLIQPEGAIPYELKRSWSAAQVVHDTESLSLSLRRTPPGEEKNTRIN